MLNFLNNIIKGPVKNSNQETITVSREEKEAELAVINQQLSDIASKELKQLNSTRDEATENHVVKLMKDKLKLENELDIPLN